MKHINKARLLEIQEAMTTCSDQANNLAQAVEEFNGALDEHRGAVEQAVSSYNEAIADLKAIYEGVATEARDYYEERSEKWQEGDAGQQYGEWVAQLEGVDLDEIEVELPDYVDVPDVPDFDDPDWAPPESPDEI